MAPRSIDSLDAAMAEAGLAAAAGARQVLFYAAEGLLGGTFTCSRCRAAGRQPDVIEHAPDCEYRHRPARLAPG